MAGQFSDGLSTLPVLSREVHALHSISGWQDTGTCPHQDNPNLRFLQALNEEIVNRKKNVDQAIRNGQALLKQTTGNTEEILAHWQMGGVWESILHMLFFGKSMLCWVEAFLPQVFISFWKLSK